MVTKPTAVITDPKTYVGAATWQALSKTHDLIDAVDAIRSTAIERAAATAERIGPLGRLDFLVHTTHVFEISSVVTTDANTWRRSFDANVVQPAAITRLFLPALRNAHGHVVFVDPVCGYVSGARWGAYAASRFAARSLAATLRAEEPQLRVTTVQPGATAVAGGESHSRGLLPPGLLVETISAIAQGRNASAIVELIL